MAKRKKQCKVCKHDSREQIDAAIKDEWWDASGRIARRFKLHITDIWGHFSNCLKLEVVRDFEKYHQEYEA